MSNNNMYTSENKLNQMKVVEYFVSNTNFDETWKPIVKRAAYDCVSTINGKFTASVSGPTICNMIADYLDSCVKSYFVKPCPQNKQPATLVATTCSKKLAIAARCDPFAMNEARKMSNIAVPQHNTGPFPGMIMNPIMTVDNPNIAVMPPHFPPHFPMGQPLPQIIMPGPNFAMPEPTRDCWKSLQMLPPNCCNRPILIPESEFKACENLPQGATDSSTTDDTADNPNWCQMECVFKNRNWLKDKVIDKEMVSTLVAKVTDTTWQPVVKDAFFSKCFAKNDKCKFSISQVENCDLSGKPGGIPMAAEANPNESNNKKKDETKHIIHHRVGGGSGIMGSLANGVAAGVGAGVANGVVSQFFNKGSNNGGQAQGAPQYAMPGQGMQNQGGYGMPNQGGYGMQGQGGYGMQGQGGNGMSNQGANGMQSQGGYGQGAQQQYGQPGPVKQAVPMQNSQPGQGNNPKKKGTFAEAAKKVVQNKNQAANQKQASNTATNQKQASNTATNKKQAVPQKTSDSKNTQKNSGSKKSSGGFFSKLSSKLGGGSSRRSGGGGRRG
ncbi:hypothetical protein B566_EDAN009472 [Ephemera danica]|nr:hypothetical protein B566_EDAN009472 [Ephemera danica]